MEMESFKVIMVGPNESQGNYIGDEMHRLAKSFVNGDLDSDDVSEKLGIPFDSSSSLGVLSLVLVNPNSEFDQEAIYRVILGNDDLITTRLSDEYTAVHVDDYFKDAYKNIVADCFYAHFCGASPGVRGPILIVASPGRKDKSLSPDDIQILLSTVFGDGFSILSSAPPKDAKPDKPKKDPQGYKGLKWFSNN